MPVFGYYEGFLEAHLPFTEPLATSNKHKNLDDVVISSLNYSGIIFLILRCFHRHHRADLKKMFTEKFPIIKKDDVEVKVWLCYLFCFVWFRNETLCTVVSLCGRIGEICSITRRGKRRSPCCLVTCSDIFGHTRNVSFLIVCYSLQNVTD